MTLMVTAGLVTVHDLKIEVAHNFEGFHLSVDDLNAKDETPAKFPLEREDLEGLVKSINIILGAAKEKE